MYTVYILKSEKDLNWYIGCTANLEKRLEMHNKGRARSTKSRLPFTLIYQEKFEDRYLAFRCERFYKSAKGKRELRKKISI